MPEDSGLFKDFGEKKEEKKKMDKDAVEIKIRFSKMWLERAIWIVVILILLVLVFYNPFGKYRCEKGLSEIKSEPAVVGENESVETEPVVEEVEEEPVVQEEPETQEEPELGLSGEVGLAIGDIGLDENKTRIEYIWVDINNDKGLFTPYLKVYWYGPSDTDAVKQNSKYEYQFASLIPTGKTSKKFDDEIDKKGGRELTGRHLNLDPNDKKVTFKIEVYDVNENATVLDLKLTSISLT